MWIIREQILQIHKWNNQVKEVMNHLEPKETIGDAIRGNIYAVVHNQQVE